MGTLIAGSHDWNIMFTGIGVLSLIARMTRVGRSGERLYWGDSDLENEIFLSSNEEMIIFYQNCTPA